MKTLFTLTLFLMQSFHAFAEEYISDTTRNKAGEIEQLHWNNQAKQNTPEVLIALNFSVPGTVNTSDFATSGASSAAEVGLVSDQYGVEEPLVINDPWESYNRGMHKFNNQVDKYVARPLAVAYEKITPVSIQHCLSRFFSNLREPGTAINQALQGNTFDGVRTLGRFAVNTTIGVAGLYDPATSFGLKRGYEDFGQTLAIWGWEGSRYLVVPILGPRTVRDMLGIVGDQPLSPINHISNSDLVLGLNIMQLTDARTRLLPLDEVRDQALDEYIMTRDAWITRRDKQIKED